MFNRLATQTAAIGLAALFTVITLGGVDALAAREASNATQADELVAVQQVVITGHRLPRS